MNESILPDLRLNTRFAAVLLTQRTSLYFAKGKELVCLCLTSLSRTCIADMSSSGIGSSVL